MHFSAEQLEVIEQMGYRLFTPDMVAINIEVDEDEFCSEVSIPGTIARKTYFRGVIRQQMELRDSIIKSAGNGSNPAQEQLIKILNKLDV